MFKRLNIENYLTDRCDNGEVVSINGNLISKEWNYLNANNFQEMDRSGSFSDSRCSSIKIPSIVHNELQFKLYSPGDH